MAESPRVSVVVPTRNRPERLRACLAALAGQSCAPDLFEVIVVDDGSAHLPDTLLAPFDGQLRVTLVRQAHAGPAAARNRGAGRARGALLAFTDDDCEPDAAWLAVLWACHEQNPDAIIGGRTVNTLVDDRCAEASQALVEYLYAYYGEADRSHRRGASPRFFTSNNMAVPAGLFQAVGGFDAGFPLAAGEDRELCDRWQHAGYRLLHEPNALVRHAHALSLRRFWRQHFTYGRGAWHFRAARRRRKAEEIGIEPLSFYLDLVFHPVRAHGVRRGGPLAALLALAQAANAAGYWRERVSSRA